MSRTPVLRSLPRLATGAAVLALGLGGLTACGGSDSGSTAAASSTTASAAVSSSAGSSASNSGASSDADSITATESNFKIKLSEDHLTAGTVTIKVVNDGDATHDLAVEKDGTTMATSDSIGPGESTTLTVDLAAGDYVFYCSIGNHRAMGMEIDVTVT